MRQRLGQHFLINRSAIQTIASAIQAEPDEVIFEIGPGQGALTREILSLSEKNGNQIIALEKDPVLAKKLATELSSVSRLLITTGDARYDLERMIQQTNPKKYCLVGNLPYYLTGHLLRNIGQLKQPPRKCIFMLQREVAERITARPPKMNRLAASVQIWAETKIILNLKPKDFRPPPEVNSSVLILTHQPQKTDRNKYELLISKIFGQPRKNILNNLSAKQGSSKKEVEEALRALNISPTARPQDLGIIELIRISEALGLQLDRSDTSVLSNKSK